MVDVVQVNVMLVSRKSTPKNLAKLGTVLITQPRNTFVPRALRLSTATTSPLFL